jgi:glutamate racemase
MPYGGRGTQWIRNRTKKLIAFLLAKGAKLIVVACNTSTIAGIDVYRKAFPHIPIVGVVPVVKTAAEVTRTKHIAIFATPYTSRSRYQKRLIAKFAHGLRVHSETSHTLVPIIEEGVLEGPLVRGELRRMVARIPKGVDVVALGCTHYPFIAPVLAGIVGSGVVILDSGGAVARQVHRVLAANGALTKRGRPAHRFYTTGDTAPAAMVARKLMKRKITVHHVKL